MGVSFPALEGTAIEFGGSSSQGGEDIFPTTFGRVARAIWPSKTALHLAVIGKVSERAAKDWLSGKVAPPANVTAAMLMEITKRD